MSDKINQIRTRTLTLMVNIPRELEAKTEMERGNVAMKFLGIIV